MNDIQVSEFGMKRKGKLHQYSCCIMYMGESFQDLS